MVEEAGFFVEEDIYACDVFFATGRCCGPLFDSGGVCSSCPNHVGLDFQVNIVLTVTAEKRQGPGNSTEKTHANFQAHGRNHSN